MATFNDLVENSLKRVDELFPWDAQEQLDQGDNLLILDVREPDEYATAHVERSIHVPRGILESATEYGYEETVPELADAREKTVLVICRSGKRSALAADTLRQLGYQKVFSLKTGLRGWNDFELPLIDETGNRVDPEFADEFFTAKLRPEQMAR